MTTTKTAQPAKKAKPKKPRKIDKPLNKRHGAKVAAAAQPLGINGGDRAIPPAPVRPPGKLGAPTKYTPELAEEICHRIAAGPGLATVLRAKDCTHFDQSIFELFPHLDGKLSFAAVQAWLETHASFAVLYARAFQHRADRLADEIVEIADAANGKSNSEVYKAKLRVDARKWVASKLLPERYGDRLDVTATVRLENLDDKALDDRIKRLLGHSATVIEHKPAE